MGYAESEWERVMRIQEVMMRALSGEIHWFQAAAMLGVDVRTMRCGGRWHLALHAERTSRTERVPRRSREPSPIAPCVANRNDWKPAARSGVCHRPG
jgi:hypothetical protein